MTEQRFFPGDRVTVKYETVIHHDHVGADEDNGLVWVEHPVWRPHVSTSVPPSAVSKVAPKLPTALGSVVLFTKWGGVETVRTMLLRHGEFWVAHDTELRAMFLQADVDSGHSEFTVVYDAGQEES